MKTILSKIKKKSSYLFFTFFKYLEYAILALIFMSFANRVSPEGYGYASLGFQTVTYSSFIVLGVNQVLLKHFSLEKDNTNKNFLLQYNFIYNLLASLLAFLLVLAIDRSYFFSLALICGLKLIMESFVSINRVKGRIKFINIIYLSYALTFAVFYYFFVDTTNLFFQYWALSIIVGVLVGFLTTINQIIWTNYKLFKQKLKNWSNKLFKDGFKLASIAIIAPLYSTLNILLLNYLRADKELLGNFQLADNIANVISLGGASVLFILFPDVIKIINKNKKIISIYYKKGFMLLIISIFLLVLLYYPLNYLLTSFFKSYTHLSYLIVFTVISRLLVLFLFLPNAYLVTFSKETTYISYLFIGVLFLFIILFLFINNNTNEYIYKYLLLFQIFILIIIHLLLKSRIDKDLKCA